MMRAIALFVLLGAAAPVRIDLPDAFVPFVDIPGGPAADAVNANCLGCHSAEMVLTQPRLSPIAWQGEIDKMRAAYKAPVDPGDDAAILAWLVAMQARDNRTDSGG
ncbi:cytochrome c [Polymorphobacter fuscus]|uniref:Cytochrome c n=1 Tax=Sandarakinorhabdus fusca TaxID=1439888 RepID=A0A7C9KYM3_9SPHN|nr:cytochrome c [Polymorphobacter fuscus]KAB7644120.1 cytochrome c [Polymorphobacter fuscus]MQT18506.1 cytochrome c [Polymorphobacter fuscus]NJC08372.1 hypothetical protein [Polymorphobacter fuscus]